MNRTVCWPAAWVEAAVKAGLADQVEGGRIVMRNVRGDALRDALGEFAYLVAQDAHESDAAEEGAK